MSNPKDSFIIKHKIIKLSMGFDIMGWDGMGFVNLITSNLHVTQEKKTGVQMSSLFF